MAATATAPEKTAAKQSRPEPAFYIFRLTDRFPEFYTGSSPYQARLSLANTDMILWPYVDGNPVPLDGEHDLKDADYQPRAIRYIAGERTIFVDEQEKNSDAYRLDVNGRNRLLDNEANKTALTFQNAEIRVPSYNRTLKNFLWCSNQCKNQNPKANEKGKRFKQLNAKYELINNVANDAARIALGQSRDKAYQLAQSARMADLMPHAKYLNLSFTHPGTDEMKDGDALRQDYIDYALAQPEKFLKSFGDPQVKIMYQISELVEKGEITFGKTAGQAHWVSTGAFITQLPPDRAPVEYLAGFATTKEGEEFANNLRAFK